MLSYMTQNFYGLAQHSHNTHAVRDADAWIAFCGKGIAEAWPTTDLQANVTCKTCLKGIR